MAALGFSGKALISFRFGDTKNVYNTMQALSSIFVHGYGTNTAEALRKLRTDVFAGSTGRRKVRGHSYFSAYDTPIHSYKPRPYFRCSSRPISLRKHSVKPPVQIVSPSSEIYFPRYSAYINFTVVMS